MKNLRFSFFLLLFCFGCEKDDFHASSPNVATFVQQIKNGTYDNYEKNDKGEKLWLIMPKFTKNDIQTLIALAEDTSHINLFPINPISSRTPTPQGRQYFILGECLLWAVEGVRNGSGYGSLDPYLIDPTKENHYKGLNGEEIIMIRDFYQAWWANSTDNDWKEKNPLEEKSYKWF